MIGGFRAILICLFPFLKGLLVVPIMMIDSRAKYHHDSWLGLIIKRPYKRGQELNLLFDIREKLNLLFDIREKLNLLFDIREKLNLLFDIREKLNLLLVSNDEKLNLLFDIREKLNLLFDIHEKLNLLFDIREKLNLLFDIHEKLNLLFAPILVQLSSKHIGNDAYIYLIRWFNI